MNRRQFVSSSFQAAAAVGLAPQASASAQRIEQARQAALDLLKPSKAQIGHALELHASSIVMESYGFAPRCAVDGAALRTALEEGASDLEIQDLHEEMIMTRCVESPKEKEEFLNAWRAAGMTAIFQNAGEEGQNPQQLVKRLARFTYAADMLRDHVFKAVTPEDIVAAKKQGKHCFYFSGNGVPLAQQWVSLPHELGYIRVFYQLGIRMMHLTYNRRNMLGDGCAEPANAGLSDLGRAAIGEMNRVGVIVDVAHSGWQTSLEAAKASRMPMVASHSGCVAMNRHIRCKPDEVIRAIVDTGGFVGICCIPAFLGRSRDIVAFLDHIDYVVKRWGADHVAIGTDIAYSSAYSAEEWKKVGPRPKSRPRFESFWPPGALGGGPSHPSLSWTNWPIFTVGMVQRGYSDTNIQKILAGNVLRVARAALGRR
ncbi:MAG: membrane dipeptidase [Bryobacteraceae bacterium]|nr:membrane dipeptidase [Bryobacteraceae bacterium]